MTNPDQDKGGVKLTAPQRALLLRMGDTVNALRNGDEGHPQWWIDGGGAVNGKVAEALIRKYCIVYSGKWGGQPGVLGFSMTVTGRQALARSHG